MPDEDEYQTGMKCILENHDVAIILLQVGLMKNARMPEIVITMSIKVEWNVFLRMMMLVLCAGDGRERPVRDMLRECTNCHLHSLPTQVLQVFFMFPFLQTFFIC